MGSPLPCGEACLPCLRCPLAQQPLRAGAPSVLERTDANPSFTLGVGRRFLENEPSEPIPSRKTTDGICGQWYKMSFSAKIGTWENLCSPSCTWQLPFICTLLTKRDDANKCDVSPYTIRRVNIWKTCVTHCLPADQYMMLHRRAGQKIQSMGSVKPWILMGPSTESSLIRFQILLCN